jgi:hypothetical protein
MSVARHRPSRLRNEQQRKNTIKFGTTTRYNEIFLHSSIPHPVLPRHTCRQDLSIRQRAAVGARAHAHPALRCACTGLPEYHPFGVKVHHNRPVNNQRNRPCERRLQPSWHHRQRRDESCPHGSQLIPQCVEITRQPRISGRLVNYGVKKSAVREREERRTVKHHYNIYVYPPTPLPMFSTLISA